MRTSKLFYDPEELADYVDALQKDAETVCNFKDGLRIAGAVDALEKLRLISVDRAGYIRSLAGVRK